MAAAVLNELRARRQDQARRADLRESAEALAATLPPLLVEAERIAMTVAPGVHGRRRAGPGETFWQYRRYGDGDPASAIDWRQSARTDHLFVRENEWEAAHSVLLWRDASRSMDFESKAAPCTKARRASVLTLALASLLIRAGERIGPLDGAFPPGSGQVALRRLGDHLSLEAGFPLSDIPHPPRLPRYSRIVLVSDFLMDPELVSQRLRGFGGSGTKGHLLQVLDPAEEDLPYSGRALFEDVEDLGSLLIGRVESLREDYAAALSAHRAAIADTARRWGWTFSVHRTDEAPQTPLLALYDRIAGARRQM